MNTYTSHFHGYFLPIFDCGAKLSFTSLTSINHTICNKYFLFNYQLKLIKYLYYKEDTDILFALCFNDPCIVRAAFFANIARIAASVTLGPSGPFLPKAPKALVTVFSWLGQRHHRRPTRRRVRHSSSNLWCSIHSNSKSFCFVCLHRYYSKKFLVTLPWPYLKTD